MFGVFLINYVTPWQLWENTFASYYSLLMSFPHLFNNIAINIRPQTSNFCNLDLTFQLSFFSFLVSPAINEKIQWKQYWLCAADELYSLRKFVMWNTHTQKILSNIQWLYKSDLFMRTLEPLMLLWFSPSLEWRQVKVTAQQICNGLWWARELNPSRKKKKKLMYHPHICNNMISKLDTKELGLKLLKKKKSK